MKKSALALLLALLLLLTACGGDGAYVPEDTYENVDPSTPETEKTVQDSSDINYISYEFPILTAYANDENATLFADEKNPGAINEKLAIRNGAVEKRFNIKLKEYASASVVKDLDDDILLGEHKFKMIYAPASDVSLLISGTKLADLAEFSAYDLGADHYDADATEWLSIGEKTFALAGDLTLGTLAATSVVLCNNRLLDTLDVEKEIGKSVYEAAKDGEWTLDMMERLTAAADNAGFEYGLQAFCGFYSSADSAFSLASGLGASIFAKDTNGLPTLNVNTPGFTGIVKKIFSLVWQKGKIDYGTVFEDRFENVRVENEALFSISTLGEAKKLCDRGLSLSVLPMPKASAADARYSCRVDLSKCELAAIPASTDNLSRSAAVLSELFALSSDVKDAYLDDILSSGIYDFEQTLKIIADSKKYDLGDLFGWGDFDKAIALAAVADEPDEILEEAFGIRSLAAEKALDILLKRLYGEDYKDKTT